MSTRPVAACFDSDVRFANVDVKKILLVREYVTTPTVNTEVLVLGEKQTREIITLNEWRRMKNELAELRAKLEALSVGTDHSKKELPAPSAPPSGP